MRVVLVWCVSEHRMKGFLFFVSLFGLLALSAALAKGPRLSMTLRTFVSGQGCFWGPQQRLAKLPGVKKTIAGYIGGTNTQPTYGTVCRGDGHIEAVQVEYDDEKVSFEALLSQHVDYWRSQDGGSPRKGSQYSACLFVESDEQLRQAKAALRADELGRHTIALRAEHPFYAAEGWHQDYEAKQLPRKVVLALGVVLGLLPGVPLIVHEAGAAFNICYIAIFLGERALSSKVVRI